MEVQAIDLSFGVRLLCFLPFLLISLLGTVFWIWMLIECLTKEPSDGNDKLIWFLVIFLGSFLGAAIYYFFRRPQRDAIAQQQADKMLAGKKELLEKPSRSTSQTGIFLLLAAVVMVPLMLVGLAVVFWLYADQRLETEKDVQWNEVKNKSEQIQLQWQEAIDSVEDPARSSHEDRQ